MSKLGRSFLFVILVSTGAAYNSSSSAQPGEGIPQGATRARHATIDGKFAHYRSSPKGDIDGIVLDDGTIARFPPHAIAKDNTHIQLRPSAPNPQLVTGSKIRADGEGTASFVRTDKLTLVATGVVLEPSTPPGRRSAPRELATLEDSSVVLGVANNPEGEIDTLVLQDGAIVQLPPRPRDEAGDAIKVGTKLTARGDGGIYDNVNALRADYVRLASGQVFAEPRPPLPPYPPAKKIGQEP